MNQENTIDDDNDDPNCFELSDWILENHRVLFDATKYLNPSVQYAAHLQIWQENGKPEI